MGLTATTVVITAEDSNDLMEYSRMSQEELVAHLRKRDRSVKDFLDNGWEVEEVLRANVRTISEMHIQVIFRKEGVDDLPSFFRLDE